MTQPYGNTGENILVAVDIAKKQDAVLIQFPDGSRKKFTVANNLNGYRNLSDYLNKLKLPCKIGLEATGNYHRTPAYYLQQRGFDLKLISSVAASRTREAMFNCIFWPNLAGDSGSNWPLILVESGHRFWFNLAAFSGKPESAKSEAALDNLAMIGHHVSSRKERRTRGHERGYLCYVPTGIMLP